MLCCSLKVIIAITAAQHMKNVLQSCKKLLVKGGYRSDSLRGTETRKWGECCSQREKTPQRLKKRRHALRKWGETASLSVWSFCVSLVSSKLHRWQGCLDVSRGRRHHVSGVSNKEYSRFLWCVPIKLPQLCLTTEQLLGRTLSIPLLQR